MKNRKLASKLGKMLVNIVGIDAFETVLKDLAAVSELVEKSRDFRSTVTSPRFTETEREGAIKAVLGGIGVSETITKFVIHLAGMGAADGFRDITNAAINIYSERKKKAKALVITPSGIGKEYEERLKASLSRLTQREVEVEYRTDPSLVGGVLVKVGSTMYDGSLKGQLRLLKEELIKG